MSDAVYPVFPGIEFKTTRTPVWSTLIQQAASGREVRVGLWSSPRYRWKLSYEFLRSDPASPEFQTLVGFYNARRGPFESFLYRDPDDHAVSGQAVATGNGTAKSFQVVRTFGGATEPVRAVQASDPAPVIYVSGVERESGWSIGSTGLLTFATAPDMGAEITADFDFYWRVRFLEDELEFENFMDKLWNSGTVEFISLK